MSIRLLVVDDHPVVRQGIRQMAAATTDICVVAEAGTGQELLLAAQKVEHDVVLLDLSLPDASGLDLLKQLKREQPKVPVLIVTMHAEEQFAIRALKAGAAGYLMKDTPPLDMLAAIRRVFAGGRYLSPSIAERLAGYLSNDDDRPPHERLSDREFQVLRLIATGKSTRDISTALSLSVKTISTYRTRIFEKMELKTPAELAAYVVRHGLDK